MNNNNLYNTNNFIGITHLDYFKTSSNALANQIIITSNTLENHLLNTSNTLENHSSNYTNITSNFIVNRYDPIIGQQEEEIVYLPIGAFLTNHSYIYNSNLGGEIRFWSKYASTFPPYFAELPEHRVKIAPSGKLFCYYTFDPLINATFQSGWVDVINTVIALNADSVNQGVLIAGLEAQILYTQKMAEELSLNLVQNLEDDYIIASRRASVIRNELSEIRTNLGESGTRVSMLSAYNNFRAFANTGNTSRLNTAIEIINFRISQNSAAGFFLGIGGAGFGLLYSLIQSQKHNDFLATSLSQAIEENSNLTTQQKRNLHQSNLNDMSSNMIDQLEGYYNLGITQAFINSNITSTQLIPSLNTNELRINNNNISNIYVSSNVLSNLAILRGFINSNITTEQYIPSLKCDTLNLNTGNISNINYITANEIISAGKIKQNNILLDNTYLTSNHIYNLSYNYTAERQYPPKLYNSSSTEETVSLLGKLVYRQILFLNTTSIAYGSGFYEVFSSSTFDNGITNKDKLFNHNTSETTTSPRFAISLYNSGTGNYQGDNSIVGSYYGDWVIIKLPQPIMLTRYRIYQRSDFLTKAPAEWKVYGSNDGITFIEITEASQMTRLSSYTGGFYEKTLASTFTTLYNYIGFTFNKLLSTSGQSDLSFAELQIFGKEIISNSIVSNIYTTSNAVKNIVEFDMPIVGKHYGFYISITTPININGTTFYKYDINLTPYTEKGIIQIGPQSGDTFRSFKIRVMYATMFFSYIINDLPNVCYYEVFMSYKNTAAPPNGSAGLNACAIGFPPNPTLQTIMPNNLFVIKNGAGSIDYITVVSSSQADCRCIIEDLLG